MAINLQEEYNKTNIQGIIDQLEEDLVGLAPVKQRIREIAALLLVQRLRKNLGLGMNASSVGLHMSFTGRPGTGKTSVATSIFLFLTCFIKSSKFTTAALLIKINNELDFILFNSFLSIKFLFFVVTAAKT